MDWINDIFINYNNYMKEIFGNNQFLIGMITTGLSGYIIYFFSNLYRTSIKQIKKHLFTSITISSEHEAYHNIIKRLGEEKIINKMRFLNISNGAWGWKAPYISFGEGTQLLRIFGTWCIVNIVSLEKTGASMTIYKLTITTFSRKHSFAHKLLEYSIPPNENRLNKIKIYTVGKNNKAYYQEKEFMKDRIYIPEEYQLLNIVKTFINNEHLYKKKNIPYKLGILLYGDPGTGKTSCIRALASEIGYDICNVDSFEDFSEIEIFEKTIIVIDELDSVVSKRNNSQKFENNNQEESKSKTMQEDNSINTNNMSSTGKIESFSDLYKNSSVAIALKALDGIRVSNGTIIIGTTNFPEKIDPALKRHGRFGIEIKFNFVTNDIFKSALKKYYEISQEEADRLMQNRKMKPRTSIATVQGKYCEFVSIDEFIDTFTVAA